MTAKNPGNERIKRDYFFHLKHADGKSESTIQQISRSLMRFEAFTKQAGFKTFDQRQAVAFKEHLGQSGLSLATVHSTLNDMKRFLGWLALQPGFKRAIRLGDIDYFNMSEKDARAATSPTEKKFPTLRMVEKTIEFMPARTATEIRDRALIAFTAITGIRDGALVTLKLKHFDEVQRLVLQIPNEVATKFSKRIDTFLFPLNEQFEMIFLDWVHYLRNQELFADHHPLFPKTAMGQDTEQCFKPIGLSREHWANASPVRTIFKEAFRQAGLPMFTPHRFRDMIVSEMYRRDLSVQEFKAWSQNLGHEGAMTTLTSYGKISGEEQGRIFRHGRNRSAKDKSASISDIEAILSKAGLLPHA